MTSGNPGKLVRANIILNLEKNTQYTVLYDELRLSPLNVDFSDRLNSREIIAQLSKINSNFAHKQISPGTPVAILSHFGLRGKTINILALNENELPPEPGVKFSVFDQFTPKEIVGQDLFDRLKSK